MIDIVIPYRQTDDGATELKYALRSVEQNLTGVGNVFIIGDRPGWLKEVFHVPYRAGNGMTDKEKNIYERVALACGMKQVSDDFLYMNDDHYLLKPVEAAEFPVYFYNTLSSKLGSNTTPYQVTVKNTMNLVGKLALNYDTHCPIIFNKERFLRTFREVEWSKPYGYCMKTLYCYANGQVGKLMPDMKIRRYMDYPAAMQIEALRGLLFFSTDDKAMGKTMVQVLETLFPNKSKYE